jgi:hypothetical protein
VPNDPLDTSDEAWSTYRRSVMSALQKLENGQRHLEQQLADTRLDLMAKLDAAVKSQILQDAQVAHDYDRELGILRDRMTAMEVMIRFKAGLWGAIAAMIPVAIAVVLELIRRG